MQLICYLICIDIAVIGYRWATYILPCKRYPASRTFTSTAGGLHCHGHGQNGKMFAYLREPACPRPFFLVAANRAK